jgi:[ribosomal protein S18]-alanine N-acetyltransferase
MSATRLRVMTAADLPEITRIEASAYPFPWTEGNFADSLSAGYGCAVLESADAIAGYVIVMNAVDDLHLLNITVVPEFQRRGLSHQLLAWVEDVAVRDRCSGVLLEVRPSNQRARSIYEHLGFSAIGVRRGYYPAASGREDAIVMRKAVTLARPANVQADNHAAP